ncbi:MAG TPA: hypothetical protein VKU85_21065 [bacterium]|nr:hypothetical protein [bacterium]
MNALPDASFRRPSRPIRTATFLAAWSVVSFPAAVLGVDVTLDVRDTRQYSNDAVRTFETSTRREALTVRQMSRLATRVTLEAQILALRETAGGDATGVRLENERRTYQPSLVAAYHGRTLEAGVKANWLQREVSGATSLAPESTRRQLGGWMETELGEDTGLSASIVSTTTDEEGAAVGDTSQRRRTGYLLADHSFGPEWTLDYRLAGSSSDLITRGSRRNEWTHALELFGSPQLASDRLRSYFRARSQLFRQNVTIDPAEGPSILERPFSAVVIADDSPEVHDPLEPDGISVPGLFDRDLDTPTSVNLGDSAPVTLEFGGDYRNLVYDFGGAEEFASAFLYVDTRLLNPELFRWRVFVTDDPDGRLWDEVDAALATVTYRELGAVLQGWDVSFAPGVSGRYVKLVNVKLGPTGPDLFVTEMEVSVRNTGPARDSHESSRTHEVETRLEYALTPDWELAYAGKLEARRFNEDARDSDRWNQGVRATWTLSEYRLNAAWDTHAVSRGGQRDTDVHTYRLWGTRFRDRTLSGTASWNRTVDESGGRDRTTDTYSVSTAWRAAPRLRVHVTGSHGLRNDEVLGFRSRSWVLANRIESSPFRSLSVDLDHTQRWVSSAAGAGFQRFSDFRLDTAWSPVPLVSVANTTRYQLRTSGEWDTRQSVHWSPFRGARIEPVLSGDAFHDSRVASWETGARIAVRWRMRPGLLAEGRVEARRFEISGADTTPVNTELHVSWSF